MSIASRIEAIEQHLEDDYSVLEVAGADLTNVNKNIVNLKPTWQERLLYFINNGTEEVYNNWDKATGEGTEISLNNTLEAKMKIVYKGNTYQYSTTGKNLIYNKNGTQSGTYGGVTYTINDDGSVRVNGTATSNYNFYLMSGSSNSLTLQPGTYTLSGGISNKAWVRAYDGTNYYDTTSGNVRTFTINEATTFTISLRIQQGEKVNGTFYPMLESGSTATDYEKYTNGASPNPSYPQDIHIVSGDNEIKVEGKNLYSRENGEYNVPIYATNGTSASYQDVNVAWVKVEPNTDYSFTLLPNSQTYFVRIIECTGDKGFIYRFPNNYQPGSGVANTLTITTPNNCEWLQIGINQYQTSQISQNNWEVMIEKGSTATDYEPYKSKSYSIYLGVENLWNTNKLKDGFVPASGAYPINNTSFPNAKYLLVYLYKGQSLTIANHTDTSRRGRIRYIDKDTNLVIDNVRAETNAYYTSNFGGSDGFKNGTITAKKDFIIAFMTIDITDTRCEADVTYGTTPQTISDNPIELCKIGDYQDYIYKDSGKWYLHKEIGKVVFDENVSGTTDGKPEGLEYYSFNIIRPKTIPSSKCYCNKLLYSISSIYTNDIQGIKPTSSGYFKIKVFDSSLTSFDLFKSWLANNNLLVYYILETPTNTEITDTTLINQLNSLANANSYDTQTNISQTNNDLASILNATALSNTTITPSLQSIQPLSLGQSLQNEEPMVDEEPLIDEETPNETLQEDIIQENDNLTNILDDSELENM